MTNIVLVAAGQVESYTLQAVTTTPQELFVLYEEIVKTYILAGSELEVNIETAMRNKILKVGRMMHQVVVNMREVGVSTSTEARETREINLELLQATLCCTVRGRQKNRGVSPCAAEKILKERTR